MMLFHHCFRDKNLFINYNVSFFPFNQDFIINISLTFKICVSIFAFLTGYGLMLSFQKLKNKYYWNNKEICKWIFDRLIKTLAGFWIIALLSYIICQLVNGMTEKIFFKEGIIYGFFQIIINFFGLSKFFLLNDFNSAWWYMSMAILFIISIPLFVKLFEKYGHIKILIMAIIIPRVISWSFGSVNNYIVFIFPVLLGMIFAEKNLLVKIANIKVNKNKYINKFIKFAIETIILIILYLLYEKLNSKQFWELKFGIIPVYLICYLYEFIIEMPIIKNVLKCLGKYSMDIFLIHEFIRTYYLTDWIYSLGNFLKIITALLISSLIISILVELLKKMIKYDKLINKLKVLTYDIIDKFYENKTIGDERSEQI